MKEFHVGVVGISGPGNPRPQLEAKICDGVVSVEARDGIMTAYVHMKAEEWLWFAHEVEACLRGER